MQVTQPFMRPKLFNKLNTAVVAEIKLFVVIGPAIFYDSIRAAIFALFLVIRKRIVSPKRGCKLK